MLKSIIWFFVIGGVCLTIEMVAFAVYAVCRYGLGDKKCYEWVDVFSDIHDGPWIRFGEKLNLSNKAINTVDAIAHIVTWPYAASIVIYSAVLATKEFEQNLLKKES